jgi:serine/threonine protein kinase
LTACPRCGTSLREVEGLCPACMARSVTTLLLAPRSADEVDEVQGYTLDEIIGRGGMGVVYRAQRLADGNEVAVKLLPAHLSDDEEIADRFSREAHALAAFDHAHVLRLLDSGITAEGRLFLVTELAAGGDLAKRIQARSLSLDDCIRIFREILEAIGEAHRQGILHRDIKPANILLDDHDSVRVGDFSIAKLLPGGPAPQLTLTQSSDIFGTPYYIAPEVRRASSQVDERADVYSLGVLLHEMLTGHVPMGNYEPASSRVKVGKGMDALIASCLREDPAKRPQSIAELRLAFDAALRPTIPWRTLLVIVLVGAALSAAFFMRPQPKEKPKLASKAHPWTNSLGMKFVPVPGTRTLFSVWETRRADFAAFANDQPGNANEQGWHQEAAGLSMDYPVGSVSWLRAQQFCDWLTKTEHTTGRLPAEMVYRLPKDLEWSAAAGLPVESGETPEARNCGLGPLEHAPYPWGRSWPPPENVSANFAGAEVQANSSSITKPPLQRDAWERSAPVGSFPPNALGLFDLSGNVSEWCLDEWNKVLPDKTVRGGAYHQSTATSMRLDAREHLKPPRQMATTGFRVVIDLGS